MKANGIPELAAIEKALCQKSLREFVKFAWHQVEPATQKFQDNWHIGAICEHLEAITRGQIRNLIINVPPRHSKSTIVSVMWPAWEWGPANQPGTRWLFVSYAGHLSLRDSVKCRTLLRGKWYTNHWRDRFSFSTDQNAKEYYENTKQGRRVATSIEGGNTGEGGDRLVIDDPHEANEAVKSEAARKAVIDWYGNSMASRSNDPKKGSLCLIGQRVHHADLTAHLMETRGDDFDMLILPGEYEASTRSKSTLGFIDPRIKEGELLWPERFGKKELEQLRVDLRSNYDAQVQQRPSAVKGSVFKHEWFGRRYIEDPKSIAARCTTVMQSWDCAFKDAETSSYVVGQVWGLIGVDRYLLAERREHMDFVTTRAAIRTMSIMWPEADTVLIEDKANGTAIINDLRHTISGIIAEQVDGSKEARAQSVTPECEAGNVILPSPSIAPWVNDYVEELCQFPRGRYNDRVDATSQALKRLKRFITMSELPPPESFERQSTWNVQWGMR